MSLVTTPQGDSLLEYHRGDVPETEQSIQVPLALVAVRCGGKILLIYNRWREVWELPGGKIEDGENSADAAIRELEEETGQVVSSVEYVGWMKFQLQSDDRLELGVLYRCDLDVLQPFIANDEASAIMLWNLNSEVPGPMNPIDRYLAALMLPQ